MVLLRKSFFPIALILLFAGCKAKPEIHVLKAPAKPLPVGWTEAVSKDGVVSVGLPGGWRNGVDKPSTIAGLSDMGLSETDQANPAIQQMQRETAAQDAEDERREMERLDQKGIVIHAINGSKPVFDEARTRFIVQRYQGDVNWEFEQAADYERHQYAFKPKRQDLTLPIGKALKLFACEELRNGSTRHRISYLAIDGKKLYVLRFMTEESAEAIASIADQVAQTWRIRPSK
jgi:hypothetical protein